MDSTLPLPEAEDRSLSLPAHGTTVTAADLRDRLMAASELDAPIEVDASKVESIGQAVLQILVSARAEAETDGRPFTIINPSEAFIERVTTCHLADAVGLETGDAQ